MNKLLAQLSSSPELFPARLLIPFNQVGFCRMNMDSYRQSPFLDHRMVCLAQDSARINFADVARTNAQLLLQPAYFIFHNAFTCSTLLTRYLDAFTELLILREPNILYEVATLRRFEGTPMLRPLQGVRWDELCRFVVLLLGRRFEQNQAVIIKPTDGCNNLITELIRFHGENRALFIYSPLKRFLASVLRHPPRHEWAKIRVRELLLDKQKETGTLLINPETLEVWQAAALVWLLHTGKYLQIAQSENGDRCRSLDADRFLDDPAAGLLGISRHFGLSLTPEAINAAVLKMATSPHSKATHETYDRQQRDEDFNMAHTQFSQEIEQAHKWIRQFAEDRDIQEPLPRPLT